MVSVAYPELDIVYVPPGDEQARTAAAAEMIVEHYGGRGPDLIETSDFLGLAYGPSRGSPSTRRGPSTICRRPRARPGAPQVDWTNEVSYLVSERRISRL